MSTKTKIKICGLSRERDIDIANQHLPDYIGFVLHYPKSRRYVSVERAQELGRLLNPGIRIVGVLVDQPLETAVSLLDNCVIDIAQLHGQEDENYIRALKSAPENKYGKHFRYILRKMLLLPTLAVLTCWYWTAAWAAAKALTGLLSPILTVRIFWPAESILKTLYAA